MGGGRSWRRWTAVGHRQRMRERRRSGKRSADSSGCWPRRSWRWIFSKVPCNKSRRDASRAARLARGHLRPDPGRDVEARRVADRADVSVSPGEPSGVLPVVAGGPACGGRDDVRAEIQQIALAHRRRYGYRRITAELRRRGLLVNHKRVARLMREDNLRAIQPCAFVVTTHTQHDLEVYLNLASRMTRTGVNQLWVADITYIRLTCEFVYLAVILDAYSRKVVGWALDRTLAARLPIAALAHAIEERHPPPGLVHHSDRGVQY